MSLDPAVQKAAHIEAARAVKEYLDAVQDVAMLNLGDLSVYATFGYLQEILEAEGCKTCLLYTSPRASFSRAWSWPTSSRI